MRKTIESMLVSLIAGCLLLPPAVSAQDTSSTTSSPFGHTVPLPQTASIGSNAHRQFHVSARPGGSVAGVSVSTIVVKNGLGGWDKPIKRHPPAFVHNIPAQVRSRLSLFHVVGEWIAVPKGWKVVSAAAGAQGSWGVTFVAPSGPHGGWMTVGGSGPGKTEVFSAAEGYFPGAYKLENQIIRGTFTRAPVLSPTPDSLTHPSPCAAVVSYTSGGLSVTGVREFASNEIVSVSVGLSKHDAELKHPLINAFRQQNPISSCKKNVAMW